MPVRALLAPAEGHQAVPAAVALPRRPHLQGHEGAVAQRGITQGGQHARVERAHGRVHRLLRPPSQLHGHARAPSLDLSLVQETQAGAERRHQGRPEHLGDAEGGGRPRLVVVLEEAHEVIAELRRRGQVRTHSGRVRAQEPVVHRLVVGEVEALLQELPFAVPVGLGDEEEVGVPLAHRGHRLRPEALADPVVLEAITPRPLDHVRQQQHRHVAARAVALRGHRLELGEHGRAAGTVRVVHLRGVPPGGEVGVAAVGEDEAAARPVEGLGMARDLVLRAPDVGERRLRQHRVVGGGVVGHEIEHEAHAVAGQHRAQGGQGGGSAEVGGDLVARHRVGRADHVAVGEVGQRAAIVQAQAGFGAGQADRGQAGRPHAHEPDRVEAEGGDALDLLDRDRVEGEPAAGGRGELAHPDARVDLVQDGMPGPAARHQLPDVCHGKGPHWGRTADARSDTSFLTGQRLGRLAPSVLHARFRPPGRLAPNSARTSGRRSVE